MNKKDLIDAIAKDVGCKKVESKAMVESFVKNITHALKKKDRVVIVGFGVFGVKHRKARTARNPQKPYQTVKVPARDVPFFRPGKNLKKKIK